MKRLLLLTILLAGSLAADQITFSFVSLAGNRRDVTASSSGLTAGPALNTSVTDSTSGVIVPLSGMVTASTGASTAYSVLPTIVLATFGAGGSNSVLIQDAGTTLLSGVTNDNATLVATHQGGTGAFLAGFQVTHVAPTLLSEFGLSAVDPRGSLGITFGQDTLTGKQITAVEGGGTITLTATAIPEAKLYAPFGLLLLMIAGALKRKLYKHQA